MSYKSCGNCYWQEGGACNSPLAPRSGECRKTFHFWQPIHCPLCGGTLSEIRTDGTKRWRHCYSCHMEQEETT